MPLHSPRPPSTTKQTLCVISQGVQKCTECKRGSHACIDTNRDSNNTHTLYGAPAFANSFKVRVKVLDEPKGSSHR